MKTKDFSYLILLLVIIACMRGCGGTETKEVVVHDTIFSIPVHDTIWKDTTRIVRIPFVDVDISEDDSCFILSKDIKHYRDSTYEAWVSGIDPNLDSIRVYNKTTIRTITREVPVIKYTPIPNKPPRLCVSGFIGVTSSFDLNHINLQGGAEVEYKHFGLKAGYNIGDYNYPFIGIEYKLR